jgi:ubiquinone/menaquinone biosynthesis C-methylase UbiE
MTLEGKQDAWEESYKRRENFVFYPCDEAVRFVSRHLRKRVGIDEFVDVIPGAKGMSIVDVGCGIGRNLLFGEEFGFRMYGMDISAVAIRTAQELLRRKGVERPEERAVVGDIRQLPWKDGFFHHAIADSVLDSMEIELATKGVSEMARVLKPQGYLYISLISGDQTGHQPDFAGEEIVRTTHENGTIQSYFNHAKVETLLGTYFNIKSCQLVRHTDYTRDFYEGRWHVVGQRK